MESSDLACSLYIHVPFCARKCLYCDFCSVPVSSVGHEVPGEVIEQTLMQVRFFSNILGEGTGLETVYIGGGTPSVISRSDLGRLLSALGECAGENSMYNSTGKRCVERTFEWTVEANPESLDESFLGICADSGVTRLSVGIQSLEDRHLRILGRPAGRKECLRALDLLKDEWRGDLNLDFITGIPGQNVGDVRGELSVLDRVRPAHVSLYDLVVEPETGLDSLVREGGIELNSEDLDDDLWFAGKEELERRGYRNYEISNFSIPGKECLHNCRYWRMRPYIGAGPAAVSTLPAAPLAGVLPLPRTPADACVLRVTNSPDIKVFLQGRESLWGMKVEAVKPEDFLFETLMMGLRLREGIPEGSFQRRFGRSFDELFPGLRETWSAEGVADPDRTCLRLTDGGRLILDRLLREIRALMDRQPLPELSIDWP